MPDSHSDPKLLAENEDLRSRLHDAEETLHAIRSGEVDALVIGHQVYTLESADAESNRFRGEVLAQINEVVVALDNDNRITYVNPAAEKQYEIEASDVLGHKLEDIYEYRWILPDDAAESMKALSVHGHWRGENLHIKNNGQKIFVESSVSVLRDRSGNQTGLLAVIRDISDRKKAEHRILQSNEELETRVEQRTIELADANQALQNEMQQRATVQEQRTQLLHRVVTVQEDERRRIARDIHDQLGQRVTGLRLQIASLGNELADMSRFQSRIETLKETAKRLDSEVGFLAWELRPASLDDLGLGEAARDFLIEWSQHYDTETEFSLRGFEEKRLGQDVETHLYRIMQEALNNIVKHAQASRVSVLLEWTDTEISLIVEDDGTGFNPAKASEPRESGRGLGLLGMRERAMLIGGTLEVESAVGVGTTIFVKIPAAAASESGVG